MKKPWIKSLALAAVTALAAGGGFACATGGSGTPASLLGTGDITRADLESVSVDDVMEAVSLLRPQWLRARPARTPGNPNPVVGVVVDGRPRGTRDELAQMPIGQVERITFLNAADATIRFGTGYTGGAIVVITRR